MRLYYKDVPINTIPDNDSNYFRLLEGIVNSVDSNSEMVIQKTLSSYYIRISLVEDVINPLVVELNQLHNLISLKINYSKSIKSTSLVAFNIDL